VTHDADGLTGTGGAGTGTKRNETNVPGTVAVTGSGRADTKLVETSKRPTEGAQRRRNTSRMLQFSMTTILLLEPIEFHVNDVSHIISMEKRGTRQGHQNDSTNDR
jgi:hypothetical protein